MIPPNEFIPFAEQTGYIKAITGWVLNEGGGNAYQQHRHRPFDDRSGAQLGLRVVAEGVEPRQPLKQLACRDAIRRRATF